MAKHEYQTHDEAQEAAQGMTGEKYIYQEAGKWIVETADAKPVKKSKPKKAADDKDADGFYKNG